MNLKSLFVSTVLSLTALASNASAQYYGSGSSVNVGFGGSYSKTTITGPNGGSSSITNTSLGGGIGVGYGSVSGYGGGYGYGGYAGGCVAPAVLPYYGGCAPAYIPYSPFTRCYGNPYYPPVVVAPVVYGGCGQAWVR